MKISSVKIIDGVAPTVSCQTKITQFKLVANRTLSGNDIHCILRLASDKQIALQLITVQMKQITFSLPYTMTNAIIALFDQSEFHIMRIADCAEIYISGVQISNVPYLTARIIEALTSSKVSILHITTSQSSVSVLVKQPHFPIAITTIKAALSAC